MPTTVTKVQKHISKKKGKKAGALHENSRDSQRLRRASARDERLLQLAKVREKGNQHHLQRIAFFQSAARTHDVAFTLAEVQGLIQRYLHRDDEELSNLKKERRPGRPSSTREDLLTQRQAVEEKEYFSGLWIPDMEDLSNVEALRRWSGEWANLNTLKFVRVTKSGVKHESKFPPRGES